MVSLIEGRIYKLTSPNTNMVYIGSTILTLNLRLSKHVSDWKRRDCCTSKYILEKGNVNIELLEEVQVDSIRDLTKIEQEWIDKTPNAVNKKKAYISEEDQKEKKRISSRQYVEEHYEQRQEYIRKYYEKNKEIINKKSREKKEYCKECDCWIKGRGQISKHERTPKHIRNFIFS